MKMSMTVKSNETSRQRETNSKDDGKNRKIKVSTPLPLVLLFSENKGSANCYHKIAHQYIPVGPEY